MKKTPAGKPINLKRNNSYLNTFIRVQIFSVIIYVTVFLIGAFIALSADLSTKFDYLFSLVLFLISSLLTGFFAGFKLRENGLVVGILYSLPMNAVVVLLSLIFCDFAVGINFVITVVSLLIAGGIGGILAVNKRLR